MALHSKELEFNLRQWSRKGHSTRENPSFRRFSASSIRSFRDDHNNSFRTNFIISSTASSPGYALREEIDPSNYSFVSALKALQARTMNKKNWDWLKQDEGIELNSKWNEAEKYICNPLSGEVPMECLSSKTLNSRSFRNLATTISAPAPLMILPSKPNNLNDPKTISSKVKIIREDKISHDHVLIQEKKVVGLTQDMGVQKGVQCAPVDASSGSLSPVKKPLAMEGQVAGDELSVESQAQQEGVLEVLEDVKSEEGKQNMITKKNQEENKEKDKKKKKGSGCFTFLWMRKRQRQPIKSKCNFLICVPHLIKAS